MTEKQRAAMQAALEWLERLEDRPHVRGSEACHEDMIAELRAALAEQSEDWDRVAALEASLREHMAEIHRLRAALAEDAHRGAHLTHCNQGLYEGVCKYCDDDCPALAEPEVEQEPADDVWFEDRNGAIRKSPRDCQRFGAAGVPEAVWVNGDRYVRREWQGLTDEEIFALRDAYAAHLSWGVKDFARAIEAALKEKNHGI